MQLTLQSFTPSWENSAGCGGARVGGWPQDSGWVRREARKVLQSVLPQLSVGRTWELRRELGGRHL